ncbi:MAG: DUF2330 domain-containing protein [Deltaproteobacteria bacterium]|nr:DUF2330 domain-containing protein [Deltaproteobacteria bacterium]
MTTWNGTVRRGAMALLVLWLASPQIASAVCRIVEPVSESGEEGVLFDPLTTVVMVRAPEQHVGWECPAVPDMDGGVESAMDAGTPDADAGSMGSAIDLGVTLTEDAGSASEGDGGSADENDAGTSETGEPDAPLCPDGSPATKVFGTLSHVVVQPAIYGGGGKAGMIMPVPRRADVHGAPEELMAGIERISGGWVREEVTYREDSSLGFQCSDPHYSRRERSVGESLLAGLFAGPLFATGCSDDGDYYRPGLESYDAGRVVYARDAGPDAEPTEEDAVVYETIPVGEDYEVTVLSATSLFALSNWMDERGLAHDETDDAAFERYIGEGQWFVAVQVQPADADPGTRRVLPPLVVSYVGGELPISHELTYDPVGGVVETDLVVLAPTRMQLEDGDGLLRQAQPFELSPFAESDRALRGFGLDQGWMTRIQIERRMAEEKMDTRVIEDPSTEPFGDGGLVQRETLVRIPLACCPGGSYAPAANDGAEHREVYEYALGEQSPAESGFYSTMPPTELCAAGPYGSPPSGPPPSYDDDYDLGCSGGPCSVSGFGVTGAPVLLALILTVRRRRQLRKNEKVSDRRRSSS